VIDYNIRNERTFDLTKLTVFHARNGVFDDEEEFHGNYQAAIDVEAVHEYIHKQEGKDREDWTGCGKGSCIAILCTNTQLSNQNFKK